MAIHLLNDHRAPKPTKAEAQFDQTKRMIEHYMVQIPDLMATAIEAALKAYDDGRRDEFAAVVRGLTGVDEPTQRVLDALMLAFGPRPGTPMDPSQPEQPS